MAIKKGLSRQTFMKSVTKVVSGSSGGKAGAKKFSVYPRIHSFSSSALGPSLLHFIIVINIIIVIIIPSAPLCWAHLCCIWGSHLPFHTWQCQFFFGQRWAQPDYGLD